MTTRKRMDELQRECPATVAHALNDNFKQFLETTPLHFTMTLDHSFYLGHLASGNKNEKKTIAY